MVILEALPNHEVDERLSEMRGVLRDLPEAVDKKLLPDALRRRGRFDNFARFIESDFTWRSIDASGQYIVVLEEVLERALVPWVLGRASLEASARAAWISDTSLSAIQRLERNLSLQLDDMPRVEVADDPSGLAKTIQETILSVAAQQGLSLSLDDFRKILPRKTKMVDEALGMGLWYQEFSAIVHNNSYADRAVLLSVPAGMDPRTNTLVPVVIWAYGVSVWRFFRTNDLPCDQLEKYLSEAGQIMGFPECFWEQRPQPQS